MKEKSKGSGRSPEEIKKEKEALGALLGELKKLEAALADGNFPEEDDGVDLDAVVYQVNKRSGKP